MLEEIKKKKKGFSFFSDSIDLIIFFAIILLVIAPIPLFLKYSKSNLEKFNSIKIDLEAAGIKKTVLQEEFKKDPLRCRVKVDRHVRKRFMLITKEQEQALSQQVVSQMKDLDILFESKKAEKRCNEILARLTKFTPEGFTPPKRIYIIDTPAINACCLPDGTIILFRGLVEKFNDNELAWIIAHELGHGTARHAAEMLSKSMIQDLAIEKILDKESSIIEIVETGLVRFFANLKYSRIQEDEADRLGLYYMNKAGYDMDGAISVLNFFKSQSGENTKLDEWFSTHPHPENRLKNVEESKSQLKKNPDHTWGGLKEEMIEAGKEKAIEHYMKEGKNPDQNPGDLKKEKNPDQNPGDLKEKMIEAGKEKARQYYMKKKK